MNTKKEWILNSMIISFTFGALAYCLTAGSFHDGFNEGFDNGCKAGQNEAIDRFANAYNKTKKPTD